MYGCTHFPYMGVFLHQYQVPKLNRKTAHYLFINMSLIYYSLPLRNQTHRQMMMSG